MTRLSNAELNALLIEGSPRPSIRILTLALLFAGIAGYGLNFAATNYIYPGFKGFPKNTWIDIQETLVYVSYGLAIIGPVFGFFASKTTPHIISQAMSLGLFGYAIGFFIPAELGLGIQIPLVVVIGSAAGSMCHALESSKTCGQANAIGFVIIVGCITLLGGNAAYRHWTMTLPDQIISMFERHDPKPYCIIIGREVRHKSDVRHVKEYPSYVSYDGVTASAVASSTKGPRSSLGINLGTDEIAKLIAGGTIKSGCTPRENFISNLTD